MSELEGINMLLYKRIQIDLEAKGAEVKNLEVLSVANNLIPNKNLANIHEH